MEDKIKKIVFWQVSPSIHQAPYIKEIKNYLPNVEIQCVFQRDIDMSRKKIGWVAPDYGDTYLIYENDTGKLREIYKNNLENTVHIFSSLTNNSSIRDIYKLTKYQKCLLVGLISESYDPKGLKGFVRKLRRIFIEKQLLNDIDFILAIGEQSYAWFEKCGVPKYRIFPFAYVIESKFDDNYNQRINDGCNIIFIGALCKRKNVGLLLASLSKINLSKWKLVIVGDGPERKALEKITLNLGIVENVLYMGSIDNDKIGDILLKQDILVLPSVWDGWGAVVNEALSSGLPVICSNQCGASEVIIAGWNGEVFKYNSEESLKDTLSNYIEARDIKYATRKEIAMYAENLAGPSIAKYFVNIILSINKPRKVGKPMPPWKINHSIE